MGSRTNQGLISPQNQDRPPQDDRVGYVMNLPPRHPQQTPGNRVLTAAIVLQRGEKLDDLVAKSDGLSMQSKAFYKQAKKQNSCWYV